MRITTYEKGGNSLNPFIKLSIFLMIVLCLFVMPVSAFDDSVQRYTVDFEEVWDLYKIEAHPGGSASDNTDVVNTPVLYPTSNGLYLHQGASGSIGSYTKTWITSYEMITPSYFSFTVRPYAFTYSEGQEYGYGKGTYFEYINESDVVIFTSDNLGTHFLSYHDNNRWELVTSVNAVLLYVDGVYIANIGTFTGLQTNSYIRIKQQTDRNGEIGICYDDFSSSSVIGMNAVWTQADTNIDTSYGIQSQSSFPTDEYTIKVTRPSLSETINTTSLGTGTTGNESGFVRWNRNDIFDSNFGLYQATLYRESDVLANTYFSIFDTTIQGSVDWEKDSYTIDESSAIGYSITNGDLSVYTYTLRVIDSLQQIKESYILNSYSGIKSPNLAGYSTGTYYAVLSRKNKATSKVDDFAFDTVEISAEGVTPSSYINFGLDQYTIGDMASYTFNWADDDTSFWTRERIVIEKDGVILDRINAELSGTRYLDMDKLGRYSISLISYGLLTYGNPVIHASDNVECIESLDSYINVPSTTAIKTNFTAMYLYGSTPISPIINIKVLQNDYTYKVIDTKILPLAVAGTTYTINLSISSLSPIGYYVVELYDNGQGKSFATDTIKTTYAYIPPSDVVLSSYVNTTDSIYSLGGIISGSYAIDDTNYTDYYTKLQVYNIDKDIISFSFIPLHQVDNFDIPITNSELDFYSDGVNRYLISTNFLAGQNAVRLASYNDDGSLNEVIIQKNITLSIINDEGYGLTLSKYTVDETEIFAIKVITPVQASIVIHPLTLMGISDTIILINGSTQMSYAIGIADTYTISLVSGGETKITQIIKVFEGEEIIAPIDEDDIIPDTTFQDNTTNLLNSPYLIGLLIMALFLGIGSTKGIGGMIVTGSMALGIVCYMGIFPWILLVIEVLVVAALMAKGMINLAGD